jgi:hypothetical protein
MWWFAAVVEAIFIAYCLCARRVPLTLPPLLYVDRQESPRLYWILIGWCFSGEVLFLVMAVRQLFVPAK